MPWVRLDYDPTRLEAVLSASRDLSPTAWAEVRRTLEERGQGVRTRPEGAVSMPWWSFLGVRRDIGYLRRKHAQAYGAIWEFTEAARRHLERAATSEQRYSGSTVAEKLHADAIEDTLVRRGFTRRLMPYQLSNVERLCNLPAAAAFSVPGAGKTTEALAVFALLRTHESRLVIVAPKNAFAVWEEQIGICFAGQRFAISRLTGGRSAITLALNDAPDVVIVGYQQLPHASAATDQGRFDGFRLVGPCASPLREGRSEVAGRVTGWRM